MVSADTEKRHRAKLNNKEGEEEYKKKQDEHI